LILDNIFKDIGQIVADGSGEVLFQIQCAPLGGRRKLLDIAQMYSQVTIWFYVTVSWRSSDVHQASQKDSGL